MLDGQGIVRAHCKEFFLEALHGLFAAKATGALLSPY
jgi:hypothetical protein